MQKKKMPVLISLRPHISSINKPIIGSDDGLSPIQHQAIFWTNDDICQSDPQEQISVKFQLKKKKTKQFLFKEIILEMLSANGGHFVSASVC